MRLRSRRGGGGMTPERLASESLQKLLYRPTDAGRDFRYGRRKSTRGFPEQDIDDVEKIALDRSNFAGAEASLLMPKSLLDTDTLSAVIKQNPMALSHSRSYLATYRRAYVLSIITRYEVLRGLKAKRRWSRSPRLKSCARSAKFCR